MAEADRLARPAAGAAAMTGVRPEERDRRGTNKWLLMSTSTNKTTTTARTRRMTIISADQSTVRRPAI
jgi:hypothetical protein